jgi:hypothetical protein
MNRTIRALQLAKQRPDSKEDIRDRLRRNLASAKAIADREVAFPRLSAENADAAIAYQDERYQLHYRALRAEDGLL